MMGDKPPDYSEESWILIIDGLVKKTLEFSSTMLDFNVKIPLNPPFPRGRQVPPLVKGSPPFIKGGRGD
jgi:hypothetical protein